MRAMFVRQMLGVLIVNSVVTLATTISGVPDKVDSICDGKTVPNGVVKCLEDNSCFLSCDYGFSAVENHKYDCNIASASSDPSTPLQDDCGCAENMAFVVGGMSGADEYTEAVEIVSVDSSLSGKSIAEFPYKVESPVTVWAAGSVLVCGGYNHNEDRLEKRCFTYNACDNIWEEAPALPEARFRAVGVITSDDEPWVLGGENDQGELLSSSQIMNALESKWSSGESLETAKMGHCGATVDGGATIIITGGNENVEEATRSVEYFQVFGATYEHSSDDTLGYKRSMHACSNYMDPETGTETVIIAGGQDEEGYMTNSVEILSAEQETWITGPELDKSIEGPGMAILDGQLVLLGGKPAGLFESPSKQVLAITEDGQAWEDMGIELTIGRAFAGVATVPTTLFDDCPPSFKLGDKDAVSRK